MKSAWVTPQRNASAQGITVKDERVASRMTAQLNNELSLVRGKK